MGNDYKIIKELGKGGFGTVSLIEKDNEKYALKKINISGLSKGDINNYKNEIKILSKFNSKYIVKYHKSYEEKGYLYIFMEYGGDNNLKSFIKKYKDINQYIDEKIIEKIIIQICLGLEKIHNAKIIHRDLTPDNIFIDENYNIKIGDFGVSKQLGTVINYTQSNVGKHHYSAPELEKNQKYDYKVDIYALGCIIYELFTLNEYYLDTKFNHKEGKINLEIYNSKWQKLIEKLLSNDFHDRPNIKNICEMINKEKKNEIVLTLLINKTEIGKQIYFMDKSEIYNNLKEINNLNTDLFINDIKKDFSKYFYPEKEGIYKIKIVFHFYIRNCSYMFCNCSNIKSIDLSSLDSKNITNMGYMFYKCYNLENIDIGSFNTTNVTNMAYMFYECNNLKKLDLSSFNTNQVSFMEGMFAFCKHLESVILSTFEAKNNIDMEYMFGYCSNLKYIYLYSFDPKIDIDKIFYNCPDLKEIKVKKNISLQKTIEHPYLKKNIKINEVKS